MRGPWVAGVLANNVSSFGGTSCLGGTRYNTFLTQPFFNYNFGEGWYAGSAPIITANWLTAGNKAWTLPVGAQVGRVVKIGGKLPVNFLVGAYYNALRPQFGSTWQLRTQITLILLSAGNVNSSERACFSWEFQILVHKMCGGATGQSLLTN